VVSLAIGIGHHRRQFHEVDSFLVAQSMQDPLGQALLYVGWTYPVIEQGSTSFEPGRNALTRAVRGASDAVIRKLADGELFRPAFAPIQDRCPALLDPARARDLMVERISAEPERLRMTTAGMYRLTMIGVMDAAPEPLRRALLLPLASTYSVGPGLFYSAVYAADPEPTAFLDNATLLTLLVFHLSVLGLYAALRGFGVGASAASAASLWFLLTTSLYSFGFHLGSTVWMVAASVVFLLVLARGAAPRRMALTAGLLIFFSYLIILYYAAYLLVDLVQRGRAPPREPIVRRGWSVVWAMVRDHWLGGVLILLCLALFFQPGQGLRGQMYALAEAPVYALYTAINLMGISAGEGASQAQRYLLLQAGLIVGVLVWGAYALRRRWAAGATSKATIAAPLLLALGLVYLGFCLLGLLAPSPARQILFLAPPLYVLAAFGFDRLASRLPDSRGAQGAALAGVAALALAGFLAQQGRLATMVELRPQLTGRYAGAVGNAMPFIAHSGLPRLTHSELVSLPRPVLYADTDCDRACLVERFTTNPPSGLRLVSAEPLADLRTPTQFIAFPAPIGGRRFAFSRANQLFLVALRFAPAKACA